ncbi:hypothetical protein Tco_1250431, partial [Tanacetum coccineum]
MDSSTSGNPTPSDPIIACSSPSFTPFEGGDFILEEIEACLSSDSIPPGIDDTDFDPKGDIRLLKKLLNNDPSSPLPPKELNFEELKMIKSSIDYFPPLDVLGGNSMVSLNPLSISNEDFTSSDDDNVNPLFNEVLEDIESDIDEIVVSMDIEDDYHGSEGDIIYLENLLNNDTVPYLPPEVFLDHDLRSLKDELDNNDLNSMVKVFDPGISAYSFYSLEP